MLSILLFIPARTYTLTSGQIEGIWQGTLKHSGIELRIVFSISRGPDGRLTATMDVPEQNAAGVLVDKIDFVSGKLVLEIIPIEAVFEGKITEDGAKIDGDWTQGGLVLPFVLERTQTKAVIRRPQEPKEPFPYKAEEVVFNNTKAAITLAGTLTLPSSEGTFPAVLLLSGSGAQDRDETVFGHRPFLVMADYLTRRGIAVLRVDDRGTGGSSGSFEEATAGDYAADAEAAVTYLKSRREINQESIGLVGHSEGGIIASITAAQSPDIAFIVLIASPGLPIKEMEYSEQARTLKAHGASDDLIGRNRAVHESLFAVISREIDSEVVQNKFASIITEFFNGLSKEERKTTGITQENLKAGIHDHFQRLNSLWFRFYLNFDPGTVLQKVTCPVLALNGEKDVQVPAKENLPAIRRALKSGGNKNFTVKELPDLNHLLQTAETGSISEYGKIEETMSPAALQIIGDWILERTSE
ncbi:MAG: alpha/beta hydrolase [Candidatus Aminicenantes bacterium]|nr:alpha/beta hydrolase [Candidatus Aminicenantes bacterium]